MKTNNSYAIPVNAILLLGPTGSGKSPLGDSIAQEGLLGQRAHHLDFGAELRAALSADAHRYTNEELIFIDGVLERGLLLENEHFALAEKIIRRFLESRGFADDDLLVLNGIPRHAGQARDISKIADIRALVVLECSAEDVFCRLKNNVGGDRTERIDDRRGLVEKKIEIYSERTAPLINHYESLGRKVYRLGIEGTTTTRQAYQKLSALASAHPPVALVAEPPQR